MAIRTAEQFARAVLDTHNARSSRVTLAKSASGSGAEASMPFGHPLYETLDVGDQRRLELVSAYLDLSAFTARSFWEDLGGVADLAFSVLTQLAFTVQSFGGHVLGLRGDGLYAGWGGVGSNPDVDTALALGGCAFALDATRGALNQLLEASGTPPVRMKAGVDHGEVVFSRVGGRSQSEVNVVGFTANFASKCEKEAKSWEIVVGEGASARVAPELLARHPKSPKVYCSGLERRCYGFSTFQWDHQDVMAAVAGIPDELAGRDATSVIVHERSPSWASSR